MKTSNQGSGSPQDSSMHTSSSQCSSQLLFSQEHFQLGWESTAWTCHALRSCTVCIPGSAVCSLLEALLPLGCPHFLVNPILINECWRLTGPQQWLGNGTAKVTEWPLLPVVFRAHQQFTTEIDFPLEKCYLQKMDVLGRRGKKKL